jgi:hypothetical protein
MGPAGTPVQYVGRAVDDDETAATAGNGMYPHGNIFQAVTAQYTNITTAGFD